MYNRSTYTEDFGYLKTRFGKTFFRRIRSGKNSLPVICLHGGPGSTHFSILPLADLSGDRDVILYDQIGCGLSTRLRSKRQMQTNTFVDELEALRKHLKIERFHLLGHSWGTMLGIDYLLKHPKRVASVVFSSPCLSATLWHEDAKTLIQKLPAKARNAIHRHEKRKTTAHKDYLSAMDLYYRKFVFGKIPDRPEISVALKTSNTELYMQMWGPSEFCPTGVLKTFERIDQLKKIQVPALFTSGKFDEATPQSTKFYADQVRGSKFHIFKKSAHLSMHTETDEYLRVMRRFLYTIDS